MGEPQNAHQVDEEDEQDEEDEGEDCDGESHNNDQANESAEGEKRRQNEDKVDNPRRRPQGGGGETRTGNSGEIRGAQPGVVLCNPSSCRPTEYPDAQQTGHTRHSGRLAWRSITKDTTLPGRQVEDNDDDGHAPPSPRGGPPDTTLKIPPVTTLHELENGARCPWTCCMMGPPTALWNGGARLNADRAAMSPAQNVREPSPLRMRDSAVNGCSHPRHRRASMQTRHPKLRRHPMPEQCRKWPAAGAAQCPNGGNLRRNPARRSCERRSTGARTPTKRTQNIITSSMRCVSLAKSCCATHRLIALHTRNP